MVRSLRSRDFASKVIAAFALANLVLASFAITHPASASTSSDVTEAAAVQSIDLRKGWNVVALTVRPGNLALSHVLGSIIDKVERVEDEDGRTFDPKKPSGGLTHWDPDQAYRIRVTADVTLRVNGKPLETNEVRVELEAGWNLVPYFLPQGQPIRDALAALGDDLVLVKGSDGRIYYPEADIFDLDEMQPGEGYEVLATRSADLRIRPNGKSPTSPVPSGSATHTVNTMAEALALRGLKPGETVFVHGYYGPGTNGGGFFELNESGCAPDGATCYVLEVHQEESVPVVISRDFNGRLAHENIVFGSVRLHYNDTEYLTDLQMHGHRLNRVGATIANINHQRGSVYLHGRIRSLAVDHGEGNFVISYRYATTNLRLARIAETQETYLSWLGARPVGDDRFDATDYVAWLINHASARAATTGKPGHAVIDGMYYYAGYLQLADQVILRGELAGVRDGQGLRVMPGVASQYFRERLETTSEFYRAPSQKSYYQDSFYLLIRPQVDGSFVSVRDLELDGNVEGNMDIFEDEAHLGPSTNSNWTHQVSHLLQNTQYWNALATGGGASNDLHILLENVHFHSYGGNVINTQGEPYFDGSRGIKVGNSVRNHQIYDVRTRDGWIEDIEVYGYSFGAPFIVYHGDYRRLRIHELVYETPSKRFVDYPINIRNYGGGHVPELDGSQVVRISDFHIDATGLDQVGSIIFMEGRRLELTDGTIVTQQDRGTVSLFYHRGPSTLFEADVRNLTVDFRARGAFVLLPHNSNFIRADFDNVKVLNSSPNNTGTRTSIIRPRGTSEETSLFRFRNTHNTIPTNHVFELAGFGLEDNPVLVYVSGRYLNTQGLIRHSSEVRNEQVAFFWDDCEIDASAMSEDDRRISFFRNCIDLNTGAPSQEWYPSVNSWPASSALPWDE